MEYRYRMHNQAYVIEAPHTKEGKQFLKDVRKAQPMFKYCRILEVIKVFYNVPSGQ